MRSRSAPSSFPVKGKAQPVAPLSLDEVDVNAPGFARRLDAPLVGRGAELAWLSEGFDEAVRSSTCRLLTVLGPAGIGKSRLAAELCETLGDRAAWLAGRCLPYGDGITFWPLAQIVREAGGIGAIAAALEGSNDADVVISSCKARSGRPRPWAGATRPTGGPSSPRGARLEWAVGRLPGGHPLGRADPPRPDRVSGGLDPQRADPAPRPRWPICSRPSRRG